MRRLAAICLFALSTAGCKVQKPDSAAAAASTTPLRDAAPARATVPVTAGGTITGTVSEVIPVESYLYLRLKTADGDVWTAVNQSKLSVGATVTVYNVLPMEQFVSPTLKRTFALIYFGSLQPVAPAQYRPRRPLRN